jgi:hypothetical protein
LPNCYRWKRSGRHGPAAEEERGPDGGSMEEERGAGVEERGVGVEEE